ncbi:MAG: alcohol dehydrogenase catalytic domain-containing protein [Marinomonas sp.]
MTKTTNAAVLGQIGGHNLPYAGSKPLAIQSLDLAPPRSGELLVRIDAAGLCHSDLSVIDGNRPRPVPMALGHEAAATVVEVGGDADTSGSDFSAGDKVVLVFLPSCGNCPQCLSGEGYLCPEGAAANGKGELLKGGSRLSCNGHQVHHHLGVSAFAEYAVIDKRSAVKVDPDIKPAIAALFGCAVLTGVGAVMNTAQVRPGESVLIYGLGGVGLAALLGAIASGANPVTVVDPSPEKRALALELGAADAKEPGQDESLFGADVVIETAGKASVLERAYAAGGRGSRIVTVGLPHPDEKLAIPAISLVADSKTLVGSYLGSCIPSRDIPRYIALWKAGRLPVEKLLTSISPMDDINMLMDRLASGEAVRQIIIPASRTQ